MCKDGHRKQVEKLLVDLKEVEIKRDLDEQNRIADYLKQIKNPYIYKNGGFIVEVGYLQDGSTLKKSLIKSFRNCL